MLAGTTAHCRVLSAGGRPLCLRAVVCRLVPPCALLALGGTLGSGMVGPYLLVGHVTGSSQCWGCGISAEKCNRKTTGSLEVIKVSLETELKTLSKYAEL